MRRTIIAGIVGIALLNVGSIALIAWWTRDEPPATSRPEASAVPTSVTMSPQPAARPESGGGSSVTIPVAPRGELASLGVAPVPPPGRPQEVRRASASVASLREGTPAPTRRALRSFRLEMKEGFAALQKRVARCAVTDASFTLDVETVQGGLRIVDARLDTRGTASDAGVACARSALLGETIAAPSAEPGRRWQMFFAASSSS